MEENLKHGRNEASNSPQPAALSFSAPLPGTFSCSCNIGVIRLQRIYLKINQILHDTLVFALSAGALQIAMFTAAPTANVVLFMIQKKTCNFLFSLCFSCFIFFWHPSRRPEITQMKRSQLCGAWDTRSLDFMTQEVSLCTMLPICWIFFSLISTNKITSWILCSQQH